MLNRCFSFCCILTVLLLLQTPHRGFAETATQPGCPSDRNLDALVNDLNRELSAVNDRVALVDGSAKKTIESCEACGRSLGSSWQFAAVGAVAGAALAYRHGTAGSVAYQKEFALNRDQTRYVLGSPQAQALSAERATLTAQNISSFKKAATGGLVAVASLIYGYFDMQTYDQQIRVAIRGEGHQLLALQQVGDSAIGPIASAHKADHIITTREVYTQGANDLRTSRETLNHRLVEYKAAREAALQRLAPGTEPHARVSLTSLRREQIVLQAAAKKLTRERDGAAALCSELASLKSNTSSIQNVADDVNR